jgi:AcrR family transcriptional regulator
MISSPRKRLTAEQRRIKILAAATRVFARKGFDGASMSGIAAAAGVTKPVLYDHFESKDSLFETLLHSIRDELLAKGNVIGKSAASEDVRFREAVDAFFTFVEERPDAARLLLIVPQGNRVTLRLSRAVQREATAGIAQLLKSYSPRGEAWRHVAAGEFLKEGLHAVAIWWLDNPGPRREEIVDIVMETCWGGLQRMGDAPQRKA